MGCTSSGVANVAKAGHTEIEVGKEARKERSSSVDRGKDGARGGSAEAFQAVTPAQEAVSGSFHDQYLIRGKLGSGAFASVYLAHKVDSKGENPVAVKVTDLRQQRSGGPWTLPDTRRRQASTKEIAMLKLVQGKPHVIGILGYFDNLNIEGCLSYIVVEKCDASLLQVLERDPGIAERSIRRIIKEMLIGLSAVHAVDVVHRDVKPDNFLCVGPEASVRVCDFGLAAVLDKATGGLTGIFGTPPFMAPEMLSSQPYGRKVDVWSVGVIAYALHLGQFPYKPVEPTGPAMKAAILAGTPAPTFRPKQGLDSVGGGGAVVSNEARGMLKAMLNRSHEQRPSCDQALELPWFHMPPDRDSQVSLRPMLYSAKRIGCFDVPGSRPKATEVDVKLTELQEKKHGALAINCATLAGAAEAARKKAEGSSKEPVSSSSGRAKRVTPSDTSSTTMPSDDVANA